jgi:hypothetical protein
MVPSVAWPVPDRMPEAARGVRTQWIARHGEFPPLLSILGLAPHWLVAVCHARAVARGDVARELYEAFEAEVAAATGHPMIPWPPAWGVVVTRTPALPRAEPPDLGRLDPSQALLLGAAAAEGPLPTARTVKALLEPAFATGSPDRRMGDEARARLLASCLPPSLASRWRTGLGLEPPAVLVPDAVREAEQLLSTLPASSAIDLASLRALEPAEVLDLVCTVAALRLALRAAAPTGGLSLAA